MYDVNFQSCGRQHIRKWPVNGNSYVISNGDQKVYKKKNPSWLFGAGRKICTSGSLFGITRHSLVMLQWPSDEYFMKDPYNLLCWVYDFEVPISVSSQKYLVGYKFLHKFRQKKNDALEVQIWDVKTVWATSWENLF